MMLMTMRLYSKALIGLPPGVHNDDDDGNDDSINDDDDDDETLFKGINWTPTRRAQWERGVRTLNGHLVTK